MKRINWYAWLVIPFLLPTPSCSDRDRHLPESVERGPQQSDSIAALPFQGPGLLLDPRTVKILSTRRYVQVPGESGPPLRVPRDAPTIHRFRSRRRRGTGL